MNWIHEHRYKVVYPEHDIVQHFTNFRTAQESAQWAVTKSCGKWSCDMVQSADGAVRFVLRELRFGGLN